MTFSDLTGDGIRHMKANRKAAETACLGCGGAIEFGEDVMGNPETGHYYHERCFTGSARAPVPEIPAPASAEEGSRGSAGAESAGKVPVSVALSLESVPKPEGPGAAGPGAGTAPRMAGEGEKNCPMCREVIRADAMKCRFCGHVLDSVLDSGAPPEVILSSINSAASSALTFGILSFFCCSAPIFGSMAISKGNQALRDLDNYPLFQGGPRGKARAGVICGWIAWGLFVIWIIVKIGRFR
jgi:hypothetical protein